jgi:uncharacterized protein (TIGR02594 family)
MVEFTAFRWSVRFVALALCAIVIVAFASPASARPHHGRHAQASHGHHHVRHHHVHRHHGTRHHGTRYRSRHVARATRGNGFASPPAFGVADSQSGSFAQPQFQSGGVGSSGLVAEARRYIGGNPTGRSRLWCARFMNMVLEKSGHRGSGSDMARSFASYGQRISGPQVGAIAVMSRGKRGGHVGVVSGIDASGNPIVVSGNHGRRVAESVYPRGRVYAYVMPGS